MSDSKLCDMHGGSSRTGECPECLARIRNRDTLGDPADARMDLIARNGNGGEHYELSRSPTPANYLRLQAVLDEAFNQAAYGKGAERHAQSKPFEEQPMQKLIELYGTGFALGQAGKKMQESQRMDVEAAVRELLGAINYIAGVVIHLEKSNG